jgi:general secretion pathway protein J
VSAPPLAAGSLRAPEGTRPTSLAAGSLRAPEGTRPTSLAAGSLRAPEGTRPTSLAAGSLRAPEGACAEHGFTLLEVLVAFAITALLISAAVQAHIQILNAQRARIYERGRDVTAQRALDRLERELLSTLLMVKPEPVPREQYPWVFQGSDGGSGESDSLRFITSSTRRTEANVSGMRLVSYAARRGLEERGALYRSEEPLPRELPQPRAPEGRPALADVEQFQLRYLDPDSGNWVEAWDSTQADALPQAVEITLQLAETDASGEPVLGGALQRVVPLPVRPIALKKTEKTCKQGITVAECAMKLAEQLETLPDEQRTLATGELERLGERCIADEPGEELRTLLDLLESWGVDREVCNQ